MRTKIFFLSIIIISLLFIPYISARTITISLDQKDYYFKVNEDAVIPLSLYNDYGKNIDGQFTYTYSQQMNNQGMQLSSSNTQSKPFSINDGKSNVSVSFGSSSSPMDLKVSLSFQYNDGKDKTVNLEDIMIHFVADDKDKNNQPNKVEGKSQDANSQNNNQQSNNQNQDNSIKQKAQQMLDNMNKMMNSNNDQENQKNSQLQNNQMGQDSNALKKQMQDEMQQQDQMKKEFADNMNKDTDFLKKNQGLTDQGYKLQGGSLDPTTNDTGKFELDYKDDQNETATLIGEMQNGTVKNMQVSTSEDNKKFMDMLKNDPRYKKYKDRLNKEGYNDSNIESSQDISNNSITDLESNFYNEKNVSASISAKVIAGNISEVELQEQEKNNDYGWLWVFLLILCCAAIISYFIYKKYRKKIENISPIKESHIVTPFDYTTESKRLLDESIKLFEDKKYKDAYCKAGQALRLYYAYKNNLNKEVSNDELISFFRKNKSDYKDIKGFFDNCSLVEFAKYKANKEDFDKIISFAKKVLV